MAVDTTDVLTQEEIRTRLEDITQGNLQFRQAFRSLDLQGIDNDTYKIPRLEDTMGMPQAIPEGSEFPIDEDSWEKIPIHFQKYGFSVPITLEGSMDSVRNVAADYVDIMGRKMQELLNRIAYEEIAASQQGRDPAGGKGATDKLDYFDVVNAQKVLRQDLYNPNLLIVNTQGEADLLTSDEFLHASDLGDQTITTGAIGQVAGMDVVVSNAGLLSTGTGEGFMFDTSFFGYEATRIPVMTNQYESEERQVDVLQIWTSKGYQSIAPESCVKVEG